MPQSAPDTITEKPTTCQSAQNIGRRSPRQRGQYSTPKHKLATNAVKYGALSNDTGRVRVEWSIHGDDFQFVWKESGGPAVKQPERSGFGSRLIRMLGMSLKGSAVIDYDPAGVIFTATTTRSALSPVE